MAKTNNHNLIYKSTLFVGVIALIASALYLSPAKADQSYAPIKATLSGFNDDMRIEYPDTSDQYSFIIRDEAANTYISFSLDPATGFFKLDGHSEEPFSAIEIRTGERTLRTQSDWVGKFSQTGIAPKDKTAKNIAPVQIAFLNGDIAIDIQSAKTSPIINVQFGGFPGLGGGFSALQGIINNYINPLQMMAEQLSVMAGFQAQSIGKFIDAKIQLENQRAHQELRAEAVKDYHPSDQMCRVGSFMRSIAHIEEKMRHDHIAMSDTLTEQYTNHLNSSATLGDEGKLDSDYQHFIRTYCDPNDAGGNLELFCQHPGGVGAINPRRANSDIDFTRTMQFRDTLDVNFTDGTLTDDEEDVVALARNIYWPNAFRGGLSNEDLQKLQSEWMRTRQLITLNTLAHNSFAKIAAMKAAAPVPGQNPRTGEAVTPGWAHMKTMMREFGMTDPEIEELMGEQPSYHAQMGVLSKRIYQNPDFYTNLYDKPTNVERIGAALDAIQLMQQRDHYKSTLRKEMLASGLVEHELTTDAEKLTGELLNAITQAGIAGR